MKAYRVYDIHTKQIFVSGDVIFHEEVFPFHSVIDAAFITDSFPHVVLPNPSLDTSSSSYTPTPPPTPISNSTSSSLTSPLSQSIPLRRSSQVHKPPSYLKDFHCHLAFSNLSSTLSSPPVNPSYPLSQFLSYHSLSPNYR